MGQAKPSRVWGLPYVCVNMGAQGFAHACEHLHMYIIFKL